MSKRTLAVLGGLILGWLLLRGRKASAAELPPAAGGKAPETTGPSTPIDAGSTHVVAKGESLSNIAERALGDYRWWPLLWDMNRRPLGLDHPDVIAVGMSLAIPSRQGLPIEYKDAFFKRAAEHRRIWVEWTRLKKSGVPPLPASVLDATDTMKGW